MKTKIASFLTAALVSIMALATSSFANGEDGFYDKDHIRGFVSFGGDYRGMRAEFQRYVNSTAFVVGAYADPTDTTGNGLVAANKAPSYSRFNDYYLGLHFNVGAQYKQFLTWFDINFMPSQVSERPADSIKAGDSYFALFDIRWYAYGADWMFGWKILGENSFINVIPAVGLGMNLINFHFASPYQIAAIDGSETQTIRDRYYSTLATTVNAELEVRLEFDPIAIGLYGGYRYVRYERLTVEGLELITPLRNYDIDNVGDTFFFGLRVTWTFLSDWQKKQAQKL